MNSYIVTTSDSKKRVLATSKSEVVEAHGPGIIKIRKAPSIYPPARLDNDGGFLGSGIGRELDDCTVRALAISLQITYTSAHRLMQVYGRETGSAFKFYRWIIEGPGNYIFNPVDHNARTVGGFLKTHPTGPYLCTIIGHAFAVVDGVIQDLAHTKICTKTRIRGVWAPTI